MSVPNMEFFQIKTQKYSIYWINFLKYIKLFKIQDTGCYDTNATFMSSPHLQKMVFKNLSNLNSGTFPIFPAFEKKMVKFLVKIP